MTEILNCRCLPTETRNGDLNFVGAVMASFNKITEGFMPETVKQYISNYNHNIFPFVDLELPIAEYTTEIVEELITCIKIGNMYADGSIESRIDHLIYKPYKEYFKWLMPDWAKKTLKLLGEDSVTIGEKLMRIPKSLTIKQELIVAQLLLEDCRTSEGACVGLALMFLAALRNSEACGLNFGDLIELKEHPGCYYLCVYKTTTGSRNKLKPGGKTRNAPRRVPIPEVLANFVKNREEFVASQLTFPCTDKRGRKFNSIKDVPIACQDANYIERCGTDNLTIAGRKILRENLKISEENLKAMEEIIDVFAGDSKRIVDEDPTAYLFRRNASTHWYHLGFSSLQIYECIGHDLRDELIERSDFVDEEYLYEMCRLLENHPLNRQRGREYINMDGLKRVSLENVTDLELELPTGKKYQIFVRNRESGDVVKATICGGAGTAKITATTALERTESEINITKAMRRLYKKVEEELKKE